MSKELANINAYTFCFRALSSVALLLFVAAAVRAQDNYEIQVYGSELVPRGVTMIELHNNFTVKGSKKTDDGTLPTHHAWHETLEITHGFSEWFETGFYLFTSARNGNGWDFVGTHIRPRFSVPKNITGPWASASRTRSAISVAFTQPIPGRGKFGQLSTKNSSAGISLLIRRSNAR